MKEIIISGKVVKGRQKGRILGFPTANIETKKRIEGGVYAGEAEMMGKKYRAAIFVPKDKNHIEAHILDFSSNIYGKIIKVVIQRKIREVLKFRNDQDLACQIMKDINLISTKE